MNTITKLVVLVSLSLICSKANAQDSIQKTNNSDKIENLEQLKESITNEEKELLKAEVEIINQRLDKGEITQERADVLKNEAAQKHALNIENRLAIIDNKIALLRRNDDTYQNNDEGKNSLMISFGKKGGLHIKNKNKQLKYDIRTTNDMLFAIGLNNAIIDGKGLDKSPYEVLGSGFVELGWNWKTRLLENSNFIRIKYGFSFQWNKLNVKDNLYFEKEGNVTSLQEFPVELDQSQFRVTNLVFPVYLEFGPSKKIDKETHIRYINADNFKVGVGGYAGFNIGTQQKLRYSEEGDKVKQKTRTDYNTNDFVYGVGAYIGIGDLSLYAKCSLEHHL
ncbi:MAG: hypothetical protein R2783_04350 [Gelidibacter sp.]